VQALPNPPIALLGLDGNILLGLVGELRRVDGSFELEPLDDKA
jgi:hypothetical protein